MHLAFDEFHLWYQFGLSLMCSAKVKKDFYIVFGWKKRACCKYVLYIHFLSNFEGISLSEQTVETCLSRVSVTESVFSDCFPIKDKIPWPGVQLKCSSHLWFKSFLTHLTSKTRGCDLLFFFFLVLTSIIDIRSMFKDICRQHWCFDVVC